MAKYRCSSCGTIYEGELPNCPNCGKAMKYAPKEVHANAIPIVEEDVIKYEAPKFGGKKIAYNILYLLMALTGIGLANFVFFAPLYKTSTGRLHSIFTSFFIFMENGLFEYFEGWQAEEMVLVVVCLTFYTLFVAFILLEIVFSILGFIQGLSAFTRKDIYPPLMDGAPKRIGDPHNVLGLFITDFIFLFGIRFLAILIPGVFEGCFNRLFWPLWIVYALYIGVYMALVIAKTIVKANIHE